jgi:hypothetical protein
VAAIVGRTGVELGDDPTRNVCRWESIYLYGYNVSVGKDAIPDAARIHGGRQYPNDHPLDRLIDFFNRPPAVVRGLGVFLIVALPRDEFIDLNEEFNFE